MTVWRDPTYLRQVLLAAGYSSDTARLVPVPRKEGDEEQREVYDVILTTLPDIPAKPPEAKDASA